MELLIVESNVMMDTRMHTRQITADLMDGYHSVVMESRTPTRNATLLISDLANVPPNVLFSAVTV